MTMKVEKNIKIMHGLGCPECKIHDEFYEKFNSDSRKNVSYFGVISYKYYVMPVKTDEDQKQDDQEKSHKIGSDDNSKKKQNNICFLQLLNEWTVRDLIAKRLKQENGLSSKHLEQKNELFSSHKKRKRKSDSKPPFYIPEHTDKLITIKKSDSAEKLCTEKLGTTKVVYNCKLTQKSQSKEKVAPKEPKLGTLKRKRYNWKKLKSEESYEDDLFADIKLKRFDLETESNESNKSETEVNSPTWSVQVSPRQLSRSPSYEDCYSLTELQNSRKDAEEYQYRRNKRRKYVAKCKKNGPEAPMEQDPVTYSTLLEVSDKVKELQHIGEELEHKREENTDSEEDHYFTSEEESD